MAGILALAWVPVTAVAQEVVSGQSLATGAKMMAVTPHPAATQAAYDMLARGGTAADAAIAAQWVLGVVTPQSTGPGGGGFALYYDAATRKTASYDGRETAPKMAGQYMFRGGDGNPMKFYDAAVGGRAVGVPGVPALMEKLHAAHGRLSWRDLFSPAITTAETGFEVSPRLADEVRIARARLRHDTDAQLHFMPDSSTPVPAGYILQNAKYAAMLRDMAINGTGSFYKGALAEEIVKTVREDKNPGMMSPEDMAAYKVVERPPVCAPYRAYRVCSVGEPSSGGLTLLSILGMIQHFDLPSMGPNDPKSWHVMGEASRLAFADRNYYMADPDKVKTPGTALIDPAYLTARAKLISGDAPMKSAMPGKPPGWTGAPAAPDAATPPPGTSHISIVDGYGNAISMTTSIESAFGSHVMVSGFLLNSQLTDFSFEPDHEGKPVANRVQGGKRPRSSMAPVIVFDAAGVPVLMIGSAGGSAIIGYILERIVAVLDWGLPVDTALSISNVIQRGNGFEIEETAGTLGEKIKALGHPVTMKPLDSDIIAIHRQDGVYIGAADPRREGTAKGM
jgi:gamma-glutamyltranspeptidase/glutathione hydrolase